MLLPRPLEEDEEEERPRPLAPLRWQRPHPLHWFSL
jgi:hypothetical protein